MLNDSDNEQKLSVNSIIEKTQLTFKALVIPLAKQEAASCEVME